MTELLSVALAYRSYSDRLKIAGLRFKTFNNCKGNSSLRAFQADCQHSLLPVLTLKSPCPFRMAEAFRFITIISQRDRKPLGLGSGTAQKSK